MTDYVYYIRRGDCIKIGWTQRFHSRMRQLGPDELLAVEPGDYRIEDQRHRQFAEFNVPNHAGGREWFRPEPRLLGHIAELAQMHEKPQFPPPPKTKTYDPDLPLREQPWKYDVPAKFFGASADHHLHRCVDACSWPDAS